MLTITYAEAKATAAVLDAEVSRLGKICAEFPRMKNGLTPDSVRAKPEWKKAKAEYLSAFEGLRKFNKVYVKLFKKEIRADRKYK